MTVASSDVLSTLRDLPPRHFEQFVADVWQERQGWDTEVMDAGRDRGIDVLGRPPNGGPKTVVQCKRYAEENKITSSQVQQYAALRQQRTDVQGVTVVTSSSFTRAARELAEELDVKRINGDDLVKIVERYDSGEILEWYAAGKPSTW
jgi:restriction system protein